MVERMVEQTVVLTVVLTVASWVAWKAVEKVDLMVGQTVAMTGDARAACSVVSTVGSMAA